MRWLRSLVDRSHSGVDTGVVASLDLALIDPEGHTSALLAAAEEPESPEYGRAAAAMEQWPARRWLELDAVRLDAWAWYADTITPRGGWSAAIERADVPTLLVVLASTHRDGYLRERAARILAGHAGRLASAALAVRAVDHVPEVREVARQALDVRLDTDDAGAVVPILLAARQREAAAGAFERYVGGLSEETVRSLVRSPDVETRRFAIHHAPFSPTELVRIAASDRDVKARITAARRAISVDETVARDLLGVRPASVRALAVSVAPEPVVTPHLDQLLLDRSASLRRASQARARQLGVDAAGLYRGRLPARTAVLGLGETGGEEDVERLLPLADTEHGPGVRRAAVSALGRLAPREELLTLLPPLLEADQPGLVREAARQLRRIGFTLAGATLDRALTNPHVWTRQAVLGIAMGSRGWDVPVAALVLYDDQDESVRDYARSALGAWLARRAPTAGRPTSEQAERLRASLARANLSADLERLVRFHAGL